MNKIGELKITRMPKGFLETKLWKTPFWPLLRLIGSPRKYYFMRPKDMTLATLKAVSSEILALQIPDGPISLSFIFQVTLENPDRMAKILALAITNHPKKPTRKIEKWLNNNLSTVDFAQAFLAVRINMPVDEFLETLSLVRTINILSDQETEKDGTQIHRAIQHGSSDSECNSENPKD